MAKPVQLPALSTIRVVQQLVLAAVVLLLLIFSVKTLWLPPAGKSPNVVVWLIHCVPLLVFVPGLLRHRGRSYAALCFVILVYFISAGSNMFSPAVTLYDWATMGLTVVIFIAGTMAARWQGALDAQEASNNE